MERMSARAQSQDGAEGMAEEVGNRQYSQHGLGDKGLSRAAGPLHSLYTMGQGTGKV